MAAASNLSFLVALGAGLPSFPFPPPPPPLRPPPRPLVPLVPGRGLLHGASGPAARRADPPGAPPERRLLHRRVLPRLHGPWSLLQPPGTVLRRIHGLDPQGGRDRHCPVRPVRDRPLQDPGPHARVAPARPGPPRGVAGLGPGGDRLCRRLGPP